MYLSSSLLVVLLVFFINFESYVDAVHCKKDKQCKVSRIACADCIIHNYPFCTSAICIDQQCGTLKPCSLQLSGNCTTDGDCVRNFLCKVCDKHKAPSCVTARCFNNQCALIQPCTISLQP